MTRKAISDIKGMSCYKDYYITADGLVFSAKYSTDRLMRCNYLDGYKIIRLSNGRGVHKAFYVHKLVALAFLPNPLHATMIRHKNGDRTDNKITNLEWLIKKNTEFKEIQQKEIKKDYIDPSCLIVNKEFSDKIRLVHYATIKKGLSTPTEDYDFFYKILNESLDEYVNRYGLRKIMYQIEQTGVM